MSDAAAKPQTFPEGELLCFAVYSAGHAFNRAYRPLLDQLGLTYPQYLVMVSLWAKDDQTVGELGETLCLESNTLTPLLKRLEAIGYLTRSRDPSDERQVRVRLTNTGRALHRRARDIPRCIFEATGLSRADLRRLLGEISAVRQSLLKKGQHAGRYSSTVMGVRTA
jgi:MarR family transcriptional regulator, organic hydroperoxide resistance regulator